MITYKIVERLLDKVIYAYYPEGDESAPGLIEFCADGSRRILKASPRDIKDLYGGPAMAHINTNVDSGTIAMW